MLTFEHNGVTYNIPSNIRVANNDSSNTKFVVSMFKHYIDHGRIPTRAEMKEQYYKDTYGVNYSDNLLDQMDTNNRKQAVNEMIKYTESRDGQARLVKENPNIQNQNQNIGQQTPVEQNVQGMYDQIYQSFYDRAGAQYQQGMQNLGREQQQAGIANASERQKMLDGIRNYRRSALKSGLSSAQISANELQSTLISQDLMNQNQRQLGQQRSTLEQEFAMRGPNASLETWNMMNTGNLPSVYGQSYAAQIADPIYQSIWHKNNPQYNQSYKTITKPD